MITAKVTVRDKDTNILLLRIVCVFWLIAKLISWRIWTTYRLLPAAPIFDFFDFIPSIIHTILFIISLSLILLSIFKVNRQVLIGLLLSEILSCMLDQSRWQPWEFQYIFIIFIFVVNFKNTGYINALMIFLFAATYFYSGLNKLNTSFLQTIWISVLFHFFHLKIIAGRWLYYLGYLFGAIEFLSGIGLLFIKTRARAAIVLIIMHMLILFIFGPLGYNINRVIWPWNIGMIFLLYFLFLDDNRKSSFDILPATAGWNILVMVVWGVLPALSFFGYWDKNLSSNLYSGSLPRMIICINDTAQCKPLQKFCFKKDYQNTCKGSPKINLLNWSLAETNVPAYSEPRVFKIIQKKLEKSYLTAGLSFTYIENSNEK